MASPLAVGCPSGVLSSCPGSNSAAFSSRAGSLNCEFSRTTSAVGLDATRLSPGPNGSGLLAPSMAFEISPSRASGLIVSV